MAVNKAKILKTAEKYVFQGKISHAIAEYQKLIKEDPTDLPLVNTLGDLYVRIGNMPEAVKCFTRLAESYDNGGFTVRAIAMYKKVVKTDPTQVVPLARLADLYLRQGLISESRAHYLMVSENYLKRGAIEEAAVTLMKAVEVDSENAALEGKLGEVYQQLGKNAEASAAYLSAAQKLRKRGLPAQAEQFLKKAQELDPTNLQVTTGYAEVLSELGQTEEALALLSQVPFSDFNTEVLEASFKINLRAGRLADAERVASHAIEADNSHFKLRLALARSYAENGDFNNAVTQVSKVVRIALERAEGPLAENELKAIIRLNPEHIPALMELVKYYNAANEPHNVPSYLEKIGTMFVRNEQLEEAFRIYLELVRLEPNDPAHRESLRRLKDLGVEGEIPPEPEVTDTAPWGGGGADKARLTPLENILTEGDLFASYGQFQKALEQFRKVFEIDPNHLEARQKVLDMYDKLGDYEEAARECLNLYSLYTGVGELDEASRYFERARRYNPDVDHAPSSMAAEAEEFPSRTVTDESLQGLLEEIDFYLDQRFQTEARRCIRQFQAMAPSDPRLALRLERLKALTAKTPPAAEESHVEIDMEEMEETLPGSAPPSPSPAVSQRPELESHSFSEPARIKTPAGPPPAPPETSFADLMSDMDGELTGAIEEEEKAETVPATTVLPFQEKHEAAGLKAVFDEFKAEFEDDESESHDFETHYNLGIAYREMGLAEEAISEFQKALKDKQLMNTSENYLRCCNMLGGCFMEKHLPQVAIKWFKSGLDSPGHPEETYQALRYDLGCAYEMAGETKKAMETFLDIYGININYRDVADKIGSLKSQQ
jgi:tetratricopeptide (TPR) repeat protein